MHTHELQVGAPKISDQSEVTRVDAAEAAMLPVWIMPLLAGPALRAKAFLDFLAFPAIKNVMCSSLGVVCA